MFEQFGETSQRKMNVRKQKSKTLKFQQRYIISDYEFLLSFLNAFTVEPEEYYPKSYNVNDAISFQILYHDCSIILSLEVANHKYWPI